MSECDTDTQIAIDDPQIGNKPVCRSFQYYVNSQSESVVELGTMDHPYKNLGYVFIELLNFHSHSDRNITINVMENTRNEVMLFMNYIVNITEVKIVPYSADPDVIPQKATIVGIDEGDFEYTSGTSYNLLNDFDLRRAENFDDNDAITDHEKTLLSVERYLVTIIR